MIPKREPERAPERWVVIDPPGEPLSDLEGALLFVALLPLLLGFVLVTFIVGDGQPGKRRQSVKKIAGAAFVALFLAGLVDIALTEPKPNSMILVILSLQYIVPVLAGILVLFTILSTVILLFTVPPAVMAIFIMVIKYVFFDKKSPRRPYR